MINENNIINRAAAMYSKYGIKSISVDDLAFMLNISKKTLYANIENKNALIGDIVEKNLDIFYSKITENLNSSDTFFKNLCHVFFKIINEVNKINPSYVHDLKKYYNEEYKKIVDFSDQKLFPIIAGLYENGVACGVLRNDVDFKYVYLNQINKISMLLYDAVIEYPESFSPNVVYRLILNDIRGITTLKGHKEFDALYNELLLLK